MNSEINIEIKKLIHHVFKNKIDDKMLSTKEGYVLSQLKKRSTMSFVNRKEMDLSIQKMADKFHFHGFFAQGDFLIKIYEKYISKIPKQDHMNAFNVLRFLLYMSDSPTDKFLQYPDEYNMKIEEDEENFDWGQYLLNGIEVYPYEEFSDNSEIDVNDESVLLDEKEEQLSQHAIEEVKSVGIISNIGMKIDLNLNLKELVSYIQNVWFNQEQYIENIPSKLQEANIGVLWENFLSSQAYDFVNFQTSFISEYKIIREILWQMFGIHNSFVFCLDNGKLKLRTVSIRSVRNICFEEFMKNFLEYIELLEYFRNFIKSVEKFKFCQTYVCYALGIERNIINPIYEKLFAIEETVRAQDETYTLLRLQNALIPIFAPLKILKSIHSKITIPIHENSALQCSTSLLCNLHTSLKHSISKMEHDLKLALYLESLYEYFFLIDSFLSRNDFVDLYGEFVLVQVNSTQTLEYKTSPMLNAKFFYEINKDLKDEFKNDGMIEIICNQVLQIAKNIRLLFLFRKFEFHKNYKETLLQEFIKKFLQELCIFFKYENEDVFENLSEITKMESSNNLELQKLTEKTTDNKFEIKIDSNNSFLLEAFGDVINEDNKNLINLKKGITLYDRISKITTGFFPIRNSLEKIFSEILRERFTVSGLMVKKIFIEEYQLDQVFNFLKSLFLFCDSTLFSFFRDLFNEMNCLAENDWRYMKLSFKLKDILEDIYPSMYKKCDINFYSKENKSKDPLDICDNLTINVVVKWPLNIVIEEKEITIYNKLFHVFIKLKWALHTLSGLSSKDILNVNQKEATKSIKNTIKKLEVFKFSLLQLLNFIQHYVLCYSFMKCLKKFELDFEKSNDLESLIKSHRDFLDNFEELVFFLINDKDNYGFKSILNCVSCINSMWYNIDMALNRQILDGSYELYRKCNVFIRTKVNKIYLMNYHERKPGSIVKFETLI